MRMMTYAGLKLLSYPRGLGNARANARVRNIEAADILLKEWLNLVWEK